MDPATRRAERLLRCYPTRWRARYGDEFTQLLLDDMADRPRSLRRTADVVRNGWLTRLGGSGLTGDLLAPEAQVRASLVALGCSLVGFLAVGVAVWSALTIGWQWSAPDAPATRFGMLVMSGAIVCFCVLGVLGALPLAWTAGRAVVTRESAGLLRPIALTALGLATIALGGHHFGQGWPGTGGHHWAGSGLVPGAAASFGWASTLWFSSYWAHPGALSAFPTLEIAWMALSPVALAAVLVGTAGTLRRVRLSSTMLRYLTWIAAAGALTMAAFLAGAAIWVIAGGPAPRGLFRVGVIDQVGLVVMAVAAGVACRALRRAQTAIGSCPVAGAPDWR